VNNLNTIQSQEEDEKSKSTGAKSANAKNECVVVMMCCLRDPRVPDFGLKVNNDGKTPHVTNFGFPPTFSTKE